VLALLLVLRPPGLVDLVLTAANIAVACVLVAGYSASATERFSHLEWWIAVQLALLLVARLRVSLQRCVGSCGSDGGERTGKCTQL
jgi:hypothetical protein